VLSPRIKIDEEIRLSILINFLIL